MIKLKDVQSINRQRTTKNANNQLGDNCYIPPSNLVYRGGQYMSITVLLIYTGHKDRYLPSACHVMTYNLDHLKHVTFMYIPRNFNRTPTSKPRSRKDYLSLDRTYWTRFQGFNQGFVFRTSVYLTLVKLLSIFEHALSWEGFIDQGLYTTLLTDLKGSISSFINHTCVKLWMQHWNRDLNLLWCFKWHILFPSVFGLEKKQHSIMCHSDMVSFIFKVNKASHDSLETETDLKSNL